MKLTPEEQAVVDALRATGREVEVWTGPTSEAEERAVAAQAKRIADDIDADILARFQREHPPAA